MQIKVKLLQESNHGSQQEVKYLQSETTDYLVSIGAAELVIEEVVTEEVVTEEEVAEDDSGDATGETDDPE